MQSTLELTTEFTSPPNYQFLKTLQRVVKLPEKLLISEWAEQRRFLPNEEAVSGPFRFENSPWTREITDRLHPSDPCTELVYMKSTQVGGSEVAINFLGACVDMWPGRFLYIMPTLDTARRTARQRIHKMFLMCPSLRSKVATPRSIHGASTLLEQDFVGGAVVITSANSEVNLRAMAAPWIVFDEIDAYTLNVDNRGDPVEAAKRRADTFGWKRKFFYVSTPLDEQISRIEPLFNNSDKNYFHVPCLKCGEFQVLTFNQVKYDKLSPQDAKYQCAHCEALWRDAERRQATRHGRWIPSRAWYPHMPRGYHTNATYSHQVHMGELVIEWLEAQNNMEKLISFTTNRRAETWKDQSIYSHNPESLMGRREVYDYPCPAGVQVITAGVDVQDDRLEMGVYGWAWGEECFALAHYVLFGDTTNTEVWDELSKLLTIPFPSPHRDIKIEAVAIDTGHHASQVYNFCLRRDDHRTHRVWPIKGMAEPNQPIWRRKPVRNKVSKQTPYNVNTFDAKKILYERLSNQPGGPSTLHFPLAEWCDDDYFKQLTAETLRRTSHQGRVRRVWEIRRGYSRNEVLDCLVYAFAALKGLLSTGRFRFKEQDVLAVSSELSQNKGAGPGQVGHIDGSSDTEQVDPTPTSAHLHDTGKGVDTANAATRASRASLAPTRHPARRPKRVLKGTRRYR